MKTFMTICAAGSLTVFTMSDVASAAVWEIQDAGLQDTTNFVNTGFGTDGTLNSRSDISGDPGTQFNITLTGSGWQDIQIADDFDQPSALDGIAAATGSGGDLSAYSDYTMTIKNPNASGWFMANITLNTGWTDAPWNETDNFYENGWVWLAPGQSSTLTIDLTGVANLNHVTNIGFKIGSNMGTADEYEMPSGSAFNVKVIPEPATLCLLALGGVASLIRRCHRARCG